MVQADDRPVLATREADGSVLRLVLNRPKGNVLDIAMIEALRAAVAAHRRPDGLRSVLIEGAGDHFSFGASVAEHRGSTALTLLTSFHALLRELAASGRVLIAAVRGQCLGGGLEIAALCHRVVAAPAARLGNPEIRLGVIAPAASVLLPFRVGQPRADDLLLTGRVVEAAEALGMGLVDEIADDPARAALGWHARHFAGASAAALSHAIRASRRRLHEDLAVGLDAIERQYLNELSKTHDAEEGLAAFVEKRAPAWQHR
jgi:cyclohexa-1,5-dienecarbonyl-CoA hydratase